MHTTGITASLLAAATFISSTLASPILETRSVPAKRATGLDLAVYWGQGPNQNRLADFCQDSAIDVIPIGFVNTFPDQDGNNGYPGTNYANACGSPYWIAPDGTQTKMFTTCSQIAEDIPICQAAGKKILVSLGGDSPGNLIASEASAQSFANFLWGAYGPPQDTTETAFPRPFGTDVIVDGFDLDIESGGDEFYSDLVNALRVNFATYTAKSFYISGAPQCVVPDAHLASAIANSEFDYVFVQYYNTDSCSAASLFSSGTLSTTSDLSYGWVSWLEQNSKNKNVKLFVGLPASTDAAHSQDYLDLDQATSLITAYACGSSYSPIFGGVMLWEATYSNNNQINGNSYAQNIKDIINGISCPGQPAPTTTTTTTTTATTTTSSTTTTTTTTTTTVAPPDTVTTTTTAAPTTTTTTTTIAPPDTVTTTTTAAPTTTTSTTTSTTSTTTTTTTSSSAVGPIGASTTSTTSTWTWPATSSSTTSTTTTTSSSAVGPIGASTTTTTSTTSSWTWPATSSSTTTTTLSSAVGPIGASTTTTTSTWSWPATSSSSSTTTTTTSSSQVGPVSETTTTTSSNWAWTTTASTTTASSAVSPISYTTISSIWTTVLSGQYTVTGWDDWTTATTTTSTSSASATVGPDYTVTIVTTSYIDICPTGFTTIPFTLTTSVPVAPASATPTPFVWPIGPNGCPRGFTTTVTACTACAETVVTVTLTIPQATTTASAAITQTVVPVASSPAGFAQISATASFYTVTGPVVSDTRTRPAGTMQTLTGASTPVAPVAAGTSTASALSTVRGAQTQTLAVSSVVSPAETSLAPASNSGWLGVSGSGSGSSASSSSPVSPAIATFTGAASSQRLPGTALSVAVCVVVGLVGLVL